MSNVYELMKAKGYNGSEDVIELQEWLAIEKKVFIETLLCWDTEGNYPIGYSSKVWINPYSSCRVTPTSLSIVDSIEAAAIIVYNYI